MPKVPIINWSNMPHTYVPNKKVIRLKPNYKKFKKKKTKIKDKRLFNDIYDQNQHLKNI